MDEGNCATEMKVTVLLGRRLAYYWDESHRATGKKVTVQLELGLKLACYWDELSYATGIKITVFMG